MGKWIAAAGLVLAVGLPGGQFKCGKMRMSEDTASLQIPHPPDALVRAKSLRVQWKTNGDFPHANQLSMMIGQGLAKEFSVTEGNADATVWLTLVSYSRASEQKSRENEERYIKVGEKQLYDKKGKEAGTEPIMQNKVVPVDYWEGSAALNMVISVIDRNGSAIDSFQSNHRFQKKIEYAVNNQSELGRTSLPNAASVEGELLAQVATAVQRRYTATFDTVKVIMACDADLREGNKLAQGGNWKEALTAWSATALRKNEADKDFNMAVAHEAQAYAAYAASQNIEDMLPQFKKAMELYDLALNEDPQEKYMRRQRDRLQTAKDNIENVRKHYEMQRAEAEKATEAAKAESVKRAAVQDTNADDAQEAKFRPLARARVTALAGAATEEQIKDIAAFGQRTFELSEVKSYRVAAQEANRKATLSQKLRDYEDSFKAFTANGRLTTEQRGHLRDLQKTLGLEDGDAREIEAKYQVKEDGKSISPAPPRPRKTFK